ncbi:MAG: DEAD/DEAH box helicase [Candidatus Omnitrophica bacterium]|nr:DEAD/DEAH box helicase [Candidatus Omnitrophota bacterium]MDD5574627.1 DEAD/DEAH box helicase [Candidatus Omnitrophota bacterium]
MIYDRFQEEAICLINQGCSVVVSAPTGAGKTAIAEHVITESIARHTGVIYTAPIKALSNQKFRDFRKIYGEMIGIVTGDISIHPHAPVLIMTTEIFRNRILDEPETLKKYSWVIYDEIHYIDNPERGTVWEESLILLPEHMNFLGLSATIPNINAFASWLQTIHQKNVKVVVENNRPVPLHIFFHSQDRIADKIDASRSPYDAVRPNRMETLIGHIERNRGLPAIYFAFSRKKTEELAWELRKRNFLTHEEETRIMELFERLCQRYDLRDDASAKSILPLVRRGIAFHHAGMLPTLKEIVEQLFTSHLLKLIFTTETFALGINMPSRSVIFDDVRKIYGRYARNLKTRDFYQMAGRAGRRGIDTEGFVYCRIHPSRVRPEEIRRIVYGRPEDVRSQFNTSYATILNLFEQHKDRLLDIYPLSFHFFHSRKNEQKEAARLLEAKLRLLKELDFIRDGVLTEKGHFAKAIYGYELIISELYEKRILPSLDVYTLGSLAAAAVFEPRRNQKPPLRLPLCCRPIKQKSDTLYETLRAREQRHRIYPVSKRLWWYLSAAMEAWMKGEDFKKISGLTDTDEGEIVRYFRMTLQVFKEMLDIKGLTDDMKNKVTQAIRLINRDEVDAEKQLREG